MRDGTAKPVSRDQVLRREPRQGNINYLCSADHKRDWQTYPVDPYSALYYDHTYIFIRARLEFHLYEQPDPLLNKRIQVSFLFSSKQKNHSRCPVFKGSNISRVYILSQNKNGLLSKLTFSWGSLFFGFAPTSRLESLLGTGDGPGACASLTLF